MIRKVINLFTNIVGFVNKNRQIRPKIADKVKVNLGAGLTVCPGWINIDNSLNSLISSCPKIIHQLLYLASGARQTYSFQEYHSILKKHRFVCHNLIYGVPLVNNCADFVYCSHFLEHITKRHGYNFVKEIHRILRRGGVVRIVVPDLAYAINLYTAGNRENALNYFYEGQESTNEFTRHKYMYDYEILAELLRDIGFYEIIRCRYRQGRMPDIEFLDSRPECSLFVEAVKK